MNRQNWPIEGKNTSVQFRIQKGLTFAVRHVGIEFETDLTEAQEGAVGVDALAVEADVVVAALVHFCEDVRKRKDEGRQWGEIFRMKWHLWINYKLIDPKYSQFIQSNSSSERLPSAIKSTWL